MGPGQAPAHRLTAHPGWFAPTDGSGPAGPAQIAQGEEDERAPEEMLDPTAQLRQTQWDARIAILRRLDPSNPNLVNLAPPGPPSAEAVARLDAEVKDVTARVADEIAYGHAWVRHASEFPEISTQSQFSRLIQRVISDPSSAIKPLDRGRTAFHEESTNTLVIVDPNTIDFGTSFRPNDRGIYVNKLD